MKWNILPISDYCNNLSFGEDIYGSELFLIIKNKFCKIMEKNIPKIIINSKKNKHRILDNLFSHWYFWEAYISDYKNKHPLLLKNKKFNYESFKNIMDDYYKNNNESLDIENIIKILDLENKFNNANTLLDKFDDYDIDYKIIKNNNYKIIIKTTLNSYCIYFSKKKGNEMLKKLDERDFIRLIFRYYVLESYNNQLAVNDEKLSEINPDVELFASGFNSYCKKYCSLFPDIEYKLGSIGRFQDINILEGIYQINPPFQTTMIYDIIKRVKIWIENANNNNRYLKFVLFLPNWVNNNNNLIYSKYLVIDMVEKINGTIIINNIKKDKFSYLDYWRDKERNVTLPDTLNIEIISKK